MQKIVVFGGNGYVGRRVCEHALKMNAQVISVSRSGKPSFGAIEHPNMSYESADIFKPDEYRQFLTGATGAVSCVGAFGSNSYMQAINGDANILAVKEAKACKVPNFTYLSSAPSTMPKSFLRGYYEGKVRTEEALKEEYPDRGVALRPGFIYGTRKVSANVSIPLTLLGFPLSVFLRATGLHKQSHLPFMSAFLTLPVSARNVGCVAALSVVRPPEMEKRLFLSATLARQLSGEDIVALAFAYRKAVDAIETEKQQKDSEEKRATIEQREEKDKEAKEEEEKDRNRSKDIKE